MNGPELTDAQLTEVINRRAVVGEVFATGDYQVLAVDVWPPWAAVLRFSLSAGGEVDTETDIAGQRRDGSWESDVGGGVRSTGWDIPWRRPDDGWEGDQLLTFGLCGRDVEVDGEVFELIAVSGFASGDTNAVLVTTPGVDRVVSPSPTGAFVAVGLGRGFDYMKLTAMKDGKPLSPGYSFPTRR